MISGLPSAGRSCRASSIELGCSRSIAPPPRAASDSIVTDSPRLVIFDCDGVLVDSEPLNERGLAAVLKRHGIHIDADVYRDTLRGLTNEAIAELVTERWGSELPADFGAALVEEERRLMATGLQAVPGVGDAVRSIVAQGIDVCVASNGPMEAIEDRLGIAGLRCWFDGRMFSAEQVARGKPYPDLFVHAAKAMGHLPADCAVIEDSVPGIRAGIAADMRVLAFVPDPRAAVHIIEEVESFDSMRSVLALLGLAPD